MHAHRHPVEKEEQLPPIKEPEEVLRSAKPKERVDEYSFGSNFVVR
jgi:hypothetical protein